MKLIYLLVLAFFLSAGAQAQLVINEVCYDPSNTNLDGDTNGDGVYDQTQDEFIEMVNAGTSAVDISKYRICERVIATNVVTVRHTIAEGTVIAPGGAVVVFGGGRAVGTFGGARVFIDLGTAGLSMANSGERVLLADSNGVVLDSLDTDALSDNPNESYTRNPDVTGAYVQHASVTAGLLFSPGTRNNRTPFANPNSLSGTILPKMSLYPNPANRVLHVQVEGVDLPLVELINISGQVVLSATVPTAGLDVSGMSPGLYTVRVVNAPRAEVRRLSVNH